MTWRALVRRRIPTWARDAVRWYRRQGFRYKKHRESPTDYLTEYDHRSLRRAKGSILWNDSWVGATRSTIELLVELGVVRDGDTVIDYGAGIGRISRALAERFQVRVLAVDRSADMRRHALAYIPPQYLDGTIQLLSDVELLERLPSLTGSIDALLFIEVLQHIPEPIIDDLLPQLLTALKPGGRLLVLGNRELDVDATGALAPDSRSIQEVLEHHVRIERQDLWTEGFAKPRHSFLCAVAAQRGAPKAGAGG